MYVRAESDLLSPFLQLYQFILIHYHDVGNVLGNFLTINTQRKKNYKILMKDPFPIPVDRPQLPVTFFKNNIRNSISRITKNEQMVKLFKTNTKKYQIF